MAMASSGRVSPTVDRSRRVASAEGIGRRLLAGLIDASRAQGYSAISLSVIEDNPASGLYESAGFVLVEKHGRSWTMVRYAAQSS